MVDKSETQTNPAVGLQWSLGVELLVDGQWVYKAGGQKKLRNTLPGKKP